MQFRLATLDDAPALAEMNRQLIRDEGHRNPMNLRQLTDRMSGWLAGEYRAAVIEQAAAPTGYALYREESDFIYLRQLFVCPEHRRMGVGRTALAWLWENAWNDASRLRIDVLVTNTAGRAFWQSVGFNDYCITMEAEAPHGRMRSPS